MKFGNWEVSETAIDWAGDESYSFSLSKEELLETVEGDDGVEMYNAILLAMEEEWLTTNDFIDLNFAFVYAAGMTGEDFDYEIFDETLNYEVEMLDEEGDDEEGSDDSANGNTGDEESEADLEQQRKDAFTERD